MELINPWKFNHLLPTCRSVLNRGRGACCFCPTWRASTAPYLDPDTRAALEVIQGISPVNQLLATGGGGRAPLCFHLLADMLGTELAAPKAEEGAAYGAAILAMWG